MIKKNLIIALSIILFLVPGCTHRVYVTSSSFADTEIIPYGFPIGSSFSIAATQSQHHNTMLSKEISRKIANILINNDYIVVDSGDADYYLTFSYGMESSIETRMVTAYVPGTTQVTQGFVHGYNGSNGGAVYQEQTATPGTFVSVPEEYVLYQRKLNIHVHTTNPFTKNKEREQVWQASAISNGETGDLRETMDYLLTSAFKYFGANTGKRVLESHKV